MLDTNSLLQILGVHSEYHFLWEKFLDCAFACQAEFIVTDDSHFKVLSSIPFPQILVKSLDDFAHEMQG